MAEKKNEQQNLRFYEMLRKVPEEALKEIKGGRLNGKSDINPVWRIKAMTDAFGPCGIGWKYEITKQWQEVYGQEVKSFTNINLYVKVNGEWSEPIPGTGGATLVEVGKSGAYVNDEGYKMSLTDALSVSMKALGVAADIYFSADAQKSVYETKYDQQAYMAQQQSQPKTYYVPQPTPQQVQQVVFSIPIQNEIDAAQNTDTLLSVWNKYPMLWSDAQFSGAVTARKDQLMKNGKS